MSSDGLAVVPKASAQRPANSASSKKRAPPVAVPSELQKFKTMTAEGKIICLDYNLDGCQRKVCQKGLHVCMKCGGKHGQR
eukprot:3261656-Amphidinium_carterae.1